MSKTFFGFAIADGMFGNLQHCAIERTVISVDEVNNYIEQGVEFCLNPSHIATIKAARQRYHLNIEDDDIPDTPPRVSLEPGDSVIIMGVRGLPRLTDRHEYTDEEIAQATFQFSYYTVKSE